MPNVVTRGCRKRIIYMLTDKIEEADKRFREVVERFLEHLMSLLS